MAPTPLDLANDVLDRWARGESLPSELLDHDVEWVNPGDAVETGTRRTPDGFAAAEAMFEEGFRVSGLEADRVERAGETVGMSVVMTTVARGSGMTVENRLGFRFDFREGRLVRFEWSNDPEAFLSLS